MKDTFQTKLTNNIKEIEKQTQNFVKLYVIYKMNLTIRDNRRTNHVILNFLSPPRLEQRNRNQETEQNMMGVRSEK